MPFRTGCELPPDFVEPVSHVLDVGASWARPLGRPSAIAARPDGNILVLRGASGGPPLVFLPLCIVSPSKEFICCHNLAPTWTARDGFESSLDSGAQR